ncbi:SDR family oxidoreductase [Nocardia sp. NBC_00565]|uniref:SDR family oxidoreductase n=1 Tax=Nocardia sp. NBC_00565 TaxID=2975993 RepID=UPI002E80FCED|nr:SDR family oxidoreductase [Nocardia sp. NBC_00565]WUC05596.1 SDR family oxidoreductase [Nocardia sp. NBC_00565]
MEDVLGYKGRNVLVTGAASGMGAATAALLVELGAQVTAIDINPTEVRVHRAIQLDMRDRAAIEKVAASIEAPIDGYFGCAGLPGPPFSPLDVMLVNFIGSRHLIELLVPKMHSGSAVAVVASNAAMGWQLQLAQLMELVTVDGFDAGKEWCRANSTLLEPDAYSFSKKVLNAWVGSRAATFIADGIRLNCINPGPTETAMMPHFQNHAGAEIIDAFVGPIRRFSTPEEQAWPLIFLNSPRASYVNGETFTTDGGFFGAVQTGQLDLAKLFGGAGQK